jgi:hypothetical protein
MPCHGGSSRVKVNADSLKLLRLPSFEFFSIGAVFPTYEFLSSCPGNGLSGPGSNSLRRSCCDHMGDFQREVLEMG